MSKNIPIIILVIAFIASFVSLCKKSTSFEWGHHFSFENDLGIPIDSLKIIVGNEETMIVAGTDSAKSLEGNIYVPKSGYPHKVEILIYTDKKVGNLKADSFNCYNCDGDHMYILKSTGAEYKFLN
jgi:hypothetical protein